MPLLGKKTAKTACVEQLHAKFLSKIIIIIHTSIHVYT